MKIAVNTAVPTRNVAKPMTLQLRTGTPAPTTAPTSMPLQLRVKTPTRAPMPYNNQLAVGPSVEDYKQMDQRTHVYVKQSSYVGSDKRMEREMWLYDSANKRMTAVTIDYIEACERIYLEILTNASDNVGRSQRAGVDPGKIEITMDNSTISVKNYGLPMPVAIKPETGLYIPDMVLGTLLTSSNYEGDRHEAGTNGIGAKATNIFSKEFMVIVHDAIRHLSYTKVWYDNMTRSTDHVIEQYNGKLSSVQIVFKMDFERFGYPLPNGTTGGYPPEAFVLYARHAIDISFTAKTTVVFNGEEFSYVNIRDYARLYFGDAVNSAIVHYQWPVGTEVIHKKKGYQIAAIAGVRPDVELIALDTPDAGRHVSFINCMMTHDGGVHVNAAIKAVGDSAVQRVNQGVIDRLSKQKKGKEVDAKEKRSHTINIADVKPHISMLVSVRGKNPEFTSQTKRTLASPTPKIVVEEEELKGIDRWQLVDRLYAALEAKQFASLAKTDGKLKRYVRLQKGVDANQAGKADRHKCVLYITEGKSGAGYANKVVAYIPNGRDFIGVLPMRGKSLNVMNADSLQIQKNNEINELKKMLGLAEGVDYTIPANYSRLRYGSVMIMADSDVDGKHIIGLILNIFHCRFPSLLAMGFVMFYRSPIIRVTKNKTTLKFYTKHEYEQWRAATPNYQTWTHQYFKGMGTSEDDDVKDDMMGPRVVKCFYDIDAPAAMKLAFDKKLANLRKDWIASWRQVMGIEDIVEQPISLFINHELILHSLANIQRSIPRLTDGLKDSHRKIIHTAHKKWKIGSKKKTYEKFKVAQLEGLVASTTHYEHAEVMIGDIVVNLAQEFKCSNNVPMLAPRGQFGSYYDGGRDAAAARYIYTHPHALLQYILCKEDRDILKYKIDEGDSVEPETYWPIICWALLNGIYGIATAWSTTIPNHDLLDLIAWTRAYLQGARGDALPHLVPYYRGYTGIIKLIDRRKKKKATDKVTVTVVNNDAQGNRQVHTVEDDETEYIPGKDERLGVKNIYTEEDGTIIEGQDVEGEQEEEGENARPLLSMVSFGKFHIELNGTIIITELPIGRIPLNYRKWLEQLHEDKKITEYRDLCTDDDVLFHITGFTEPANFRSLKLRRTIGMSNMVLLDENDKPVRYDTAHDIAEAFTMRRLPEYQKRKDHILQKLNKDVQTLHHKIRFIRAVIDGQLVIVNTKIATIRAGLTQLDIPFEIYDNSKTRNLSEDDILALQQEIANKEAEYQAMQATPAEQLWLADLDNLERAYRVHYKITGTGRPMELSEANTIKQFTPEMLKLKLEPRAKVAPIRSKKINPGLPEQTFVAPGTAQPVRPAAAQLAPTTVLVAKPAPITGVQLAVRATPVLVTKPAPTTVLVTKPNPVKLTLSVKPAGIPVS